ncbi:MAG: hypothetical protein AAB152_18660 [Candidatus Coatesbacteria bacterium]
MRRLAAWVVVAAWLASRAGPASAMVADGTMITNVACITYMSSIGMGFSVSFCMTSTALILPPPCITAQKIVTPSLQASGGLMTFRIWVINCSCFSSAFNITMTDRLPDNVTMGTNQAPWNGGSGGSWYAASGSNNTTWAVNPPLVGQGVPYYLRYVLDQLGPCRSAFASFTVSVL